MKSRYQVAWLHREMGKEYYFDCDSGSAPGAIKQARAMLRDIGYESDQYVIREAYCI